MIAAINGYCLAGGLELALGSDIRIASTNASFGSPEVRWSILHGFGAMRLPQTVGMSVAMEMLLTGERIDARRAYEVGLISRLVEPAALMRTTEEMAQKIASNGPLAIRVTKELAWRGLHEHPDDMLRFYAAVTALIHETEDAKEGPRAFSRCSIRPASPSSAPPPCCTRRGDADGGAWSRAASQGRSTRSTRRRQRFSAARPILLSVTCRGLSSSR